MTSRQPLKNRLMLATIAVALLAAVMWSYGRLCESRDAATAAGQDLADCRAIASRTETLRRRPAVAGTQALGDVELSRRIDEAARAADFPADSIARITPDRPQRIGETHYQETQTQVRIGRVTLQQVFTFLHSLCGGTPAGDNSTNAAGSLRLAGISLSAPRDDETGDRWTVDATLTNMIYAPKPVDTRNR